MRRPEKIKIVYFFATILLIIAALSCESVVEFDAEEIEKKLVVNSLFTADSSILVNLSESRSLFEPRENLVVYVENARVDLYGNGEYIEELVFLDSGNYISPSHLVEVRKVYEVQISSPTLGSASAVNTVPDLIEIDSVEYYWNFGKTEYEQSFHQMIIHFTDPDLTTNYYEIAIHYEYLDSIWFFGYPAGSYTLFSPDPVINSEIDTKNPFFWSKYLVFSDELFNGKSYSLQVNFYNFLQSDEYTRNLITLDFNSISKEYYQYRKKMLLYNRSKSTSVWEDIVEPVMIYSNIDGGYGIFAGYQSDTCSFIVN